MSLTKIATLIAKAVSMAQQLSSLTVPAEQIIGAVVSVMASMKALPTKADGTAFTQEEVAAAALDAHAAWHTND